MESLSTFPQPAPVRAVPPAVAAGERHSDASSKVTADVRNVGVEYSQRSDGVQVVSFIDRRTGVVICQTPPQQVLAVIDSLVAAIQQREG
jgi:uncharacterized FlaG/YvyC family protein